MDSKPEAARQARVFYSDKYAVDIGAHVFPTEKYRLVKERLVAAGTISPRDVREPAPADEADIRAVHTREWYEKVRDCNLSMRDIQRLELPPSPALFEASMICAGGTIAACATALKTGVGAHLGGGFHHAFSGHGEGFCVFNDIAVGIRAMQRGKKVRRAMVVDLDVHQGNGTAFIFADDPDVFTFSMHQENNYPADKPPSDLDIGLPDETADEDYLELLREALPKILDAHRPELVVYQAGADTYAEDQLGGLSVSLRGMAERDRTVFTECRKRSIPYAVTFGGGYARQLEDTVTIHANTVRLALDPLAGPFLNL